MKEVINFIIENWKEGIGISVFILELIVRIKPTNKDWSIVNKIISILDIIIPNLEVNKETGKVQRKKKIGTIKMIGLFFVLSALSVETDAQQNPNNKFGAIYSYLNQNSDSVNIQSTRTALESFFGNTGGLYFDRQRDKWRIWNGTQWVDLLQTSSTPSLTATYVGYGSGTNLLTGSNLLTFNDNGADQWLTIGNKNYGPYIMGWGSGNILVGTDINNNSNVSASGGSNTIIGTGVGKVMTTASSNVAYGSTTLFACTSCADNAVFGTQAGQSITTGTKNTFIGDFAGQDVTTGSNNIIIGSNNNQLSGATLSDRLNIQNIIYGSGNAGTFTTTSTGQIGIGQNTPVYQLHITGNSANRSLFIVEDDAGNDAISIQEVVGVLRIIMPNLPTSSAGLPSGTLWNNAGVLSIAP